MPRDDVARALPANVEAERALLGAMIVNENSAVEAVPMIRAGEFFLDSHRRVFTAIEQMLAAGRRIDLVTLTDFLANAGQMDSVGGVPFVSGLIDGVPRVANIASYAAIVREKSRLREIIANANLISGRAYDGEDSLLLAQDAVSRLLNVGADGAGDSMPRTWAEVSRTAFEELEFTARNPQLAKRFGVGAEFSDLNEFNGYARAQELTVIVGQTSHGKTVLAEQYTNESAVRGRRVLVFSAEMKGETLALRQMARDAEVRPYWVRRPETMLERYGEEPLERIGQQAGRELPVWIVDKKITPASIRAIAEAQKRLYGLDMIVADYDQLIVRAAMPRDEFAAQAQFVAECLDMAKRLDVAYLLLCQPRKVDADVAQGKRPPRIEDVFGSSAIGNTAHMVMWVVREYFQKGMKPEFERKGCIFVLKSRNDQTGIVRAEFNPQRIRWENRPPTVEESVPDREAPEEPLPEAPPGLGFEESESEEGE
jgi:replicative DNA helicase